MHDYPSPNFRHFVEEKNKSGITGEWVSSLDACSILGVSYGALKNMVYRRQIPFYKFGRRLRFRTPELVAHLEQNHFEKGAWTLAD